MTQSETSTIIDKFRQINKELIDFIDNETEFSNLSSLLSQKNDKISLDVFKSFAYILLKVVKYHHRSKHFYERITEILEFFKNKQIPNMDIFNIFKSSKLLLSICFEKDIIKINEPIIQYINKKEGKNNIPYRQYFFFQIVSKQKNKILRNKNIFKKILNKEINLNQSFDDKYPEANDEKISDFLEMLIEKDSTILKAREELFLLICIIEEKQKNLANLLKKNFFDTKGNLLPEFEKKVFQPEEKDVFDSKQKKDFSNSQTGEKFTEKVAKDIENLRMNLISIREKLFDIVPSFALIKNVPTYIKNVCNGFDEIFIRLKLLNDFFLFECNYNSLIEDFKQRDEIARIIKELNHNGDSTIKSQAPCKPKISLKTPQKQNAGRVKTMITHTKKVETKEVTIKSPKQPRTASAYIVVSPFKANQPGNSLISKCKEAKGKIESSFSAYFNDVHCEVPQNFDSKELDSFIREKEIDSFGYPEKFYQQYDNPYYQKILNDNFRKFNDINAILKPSIFETNSFLIGKTPSLIEYAAFYGLEKTFNYLKDQKATFDSSILLYAVHGNKLSILEKLSDLKPDYDFLKKCIKEAIKCHHNEIKDYLDGFLNKEKHNFEIETNYRENIVNYSFKYYNYQYIPQDFNNKFIVNYLSNYDYQKIVQFLLDNKWINLKYLLPIPFYYF